LPGDGGDESRLCGDVSVATDLCFDFDLDFRVEEDGEEEEEAEEEGLALKMFVRDTIKNDGDFFG
jgi:hypothetical protein